MMLKTMMVISVGVVASAVWAAEPVTLKDQKDKVSYSVGVSLGESWKQKELDFNLDALCQGLRDAMTGGKNLLTPQEVQATLNAYDKELKDKQALKAATLGEKNKKEGAEFLAANQKKEGVKVLPSGLQYKIIKDGAGPMPKATDAVKVNYRGTLIDGTEFDSSYKRGEPASFVVNQVIRGWTEALQLMKVGAKWQLFIPAEMAYGDKGAGPTIAPNAVLIFEVELLGIEKDGPKTE